VKTSQIIYKMSTTENQTPVQGPNQPPIVITLPTNLESKDEKEKIEKIFPQKFMLGLSILQLCLGGLAALVHIILLSVAHRSGIHEGGFGIWTGLVFGIAGGVGIIAANRPSNCMVIVMLVLSIISTFFTIPLFLSASFGLGSSNRQIRWRDDEADVKSLRAAVAIYRYMHHKIRWTRNLIELQRIQFAICIDMILSSDNN